MMQESKKIEIEFRSRFDLVKYQELKRFLRKNAKDLGEDNKSAYFFLFPDKLLKVVNNISKKNTKIVMKLNKIGKGSDFEEIEIPISQEYFEKTARIFISLKTGDFMRSFQKRHNYSYKGIELALKWSKVWGYHLELEKVVETIGEKTSAEKRIFEVAKELKIKLMTDKELRIFTEKAEKKYKKSHRNGNN